MGTLGPSFPLLGWIYLPQFDHIEKCIAMGNIYLKVQCRWIVGAVVKVMLGCKKGKICKVQMFFKKFYFSVGLLSARVLCEVNRIFLARFWVSCSQWFLLLPNRVFVHYREGCLGSG